VPVLRFIAAVVFTALSSGCALTPVQTDVSAAHKPATDLASAPAAGTTAGSAAVPSAATAVARPLPIQARPSPSSREVRDRLSAIPTIDLTAVPPDLWDRIRNGFAIPNLSSPLVQDRQIWYASQPSYVKRMVERSKRYLYYIVDELEKRGMPTELALLPMVESAFNPMAYSRSHASGLWQFIPSTGKNYNLPQNLWYDGRRDIVASTGAALDYLQYLYEMHGDWYLALASYNWGENAVARAIEKNRAKGLPTDYLSLGMPAETRNYVPKLQALKNIIANPHAFGVALEPVPNTPYFVTVEQTRDMDVHLAAKLADMPLTEFLALNPAHNRPVIVAHGAPGLVLPADKAKIFLANLEGRSEPLVSWQTYTLKRGDRLEHIAAGHGISVALLKQVNGISPRSKVGPGYQLLLPLKGALIEPLPVMFQPPSASDAGMPARKLSYTVQHGDTLLKIAHRYKVSTDDLRKWNHIGRLATGQHLVVESGPAAPAAPAKNAKSARKKHTAKRKR
jgi:membrane-bound lytic murein transglycosylase D